MSTLAEAKADLGHVRRLISEHGRCLLCELAKGKRCADLRKLDARRKELQEQIATWFDMPPGQPNLFDEELP